MQKRFILSNINLFFRLGKAKGAFLSPPVKQTQPSHPVHFIV